MDEIKLLKSIANNVLDRLQINPSINPTKTALEQIYTAWCLEVPFDNFWKRLQLNSSPFNNKVQTNPNDFFEIWLEYGLGGTCWSSTIALKALLNYLNFNTQYITGSMGNMGVPNHGSIVVNFEDDTKYIVDTSILNNTPIKLDGTGIENPVHPIKLSQDNGNTLLTFEHVTKRAPMPCAIMPETVVHSEMMQHYQVSLEMSLFNDCIYIRKNTKNGVISIVGNTYFEKNESEIISKELTFEEISECLVNTMGLSQTIVSHIEKTNLFTLPGESMLLNLTKN